MKLLLKHDTYYKFLGTCTECGHCRETCTSLSCAGLNLGQVAKRMLQHEREVVAAAAESGVEPAPADLARAIRRDKELIQSVRGCFFCTQCEQACFAHNDVCELIYACRVDFQNLGLIPRAAWSSVLVDEEWDIFTAYRAIYGIGYGDLVKHVDSDWGPAQTDCEIAFFPGCALTSYAPELARETFAAVEEYGGKTTLIDRCCGSSLKSAGFYDRAVELCKRTVAEIQASGAHTIVCVCPGCANALRETLDEQGLSEIEVTTVSEFLLEKGFKPARDLSDLHLCFSRSCQDRDGKCLEATRKLLGATAENASIFKGCCGAGGAVGPFDDNRKTMQIETKLGCAQDGDTLVSICPTCTYTYAFELLGAPRNISNKHYLELLFDGQFDWEKNFDQLTSMWSGEYGAWLASVFS
jgi:fumarate reductase (CoM/CoB) subunit B